MLRLGEFVEMLSNHASKHWGENKDEKNQLINQSSTPCLFYFFSFLSVMLFPSHGTVLAFFTLLLVSVCTSTAAILLAGKKTFLKKINTFLDTHKMLLYSVHIHMYGSKDMRNFIRRGALCEFPTFLLRSPFTHIISYANMSMLGSVEPILPIYHYSSNLGI